MNSVVLVGNLTADPKLTEIPSGANTAKVVNFTVAVNRKFTRRDGTQDQETTFINCEAWDSGAEHIGTYFKRGDRIFVQGSIKNEAWEKDGKNFRRDKIRVSHFERVVLSKNTTETPPTNE
jgi:single-strand DNA-binding protein